MSRLVLFFSPLLCGLASLAAPLRAQEAMTLDDAIHAARTRSVAALQAKHAFVSTYWAWRSYQASRLPLLTLYGNLGNFNRSQTLLQNFESGEMVYANSYNMQNSLGLALTQNIALTGGTLSLNSDLSRIDQYGVNRNLTWYAQPVTVSYRQPLFSFNPFKWDKLISPKEYEVGRRTYLESMEQITLNTVASYFRLMLAQMNQDVAVANYDNTKKLLSIASERMKVGTVTRDEYLQLELRMLTDSIAINEASVTVREAQMALNSQLGLGETSVIQPVQSEDLPQVDIDYEFALQKAMENSSFNLENEIKILQAESEVARARANRGLSMAFNARFGLSRTAPGLPEVYRDLLNQEVVGLSFSIPIFDWGLGRGRVQRAKAAEDVVRAQVEQGENDFRRQLYSLVGQFSSQRQQCMTSLRARRLSAERYGLMMEKFRRGNASVLEMNAAQSEKDTALSRYVSDLSDFWNYYYKIRQLTLFDFIEGKDLDVSYEEMIEDE